MTFSVARILRDRWWTLAAFPAVLPLAVFAYLGTYSRLIIDDYCVLGTGLTLGPWGNMLRWRAYRNGGYSFYFLHGLVAPLDTVAIRLFPAFVIMLWFIGLSLLAFKALSWAGVKKHRIIIAVILSGSLVSATANAIFWQQVVFWYSPAGNYILPLAVLAIYAALIWKLASRNTAKSPHWMVVAGGALICFINAGFSLFHMIVQLGLFTATIPLAFVFLSKRARRPYTIFLFTGWLATIASLFLQLSAPGVSIRTILIAEKWGIPDRSLSKLLSRTVEELFLASQAPELLAGIVFMLALGIFLALKHSPRDQLLINGPFRLTRAPLLFGLGAQLSFVPLLWTHISDTPQLLGRFSSGYATVIVVNLALVLVFALLAVAQQRVNSLLTREVGSWLMIPSTTLVIAAILFTMTQIQSIHWRASAYLFFTIQLLLLVMAWQLSVALPSSKSRRIAAFAAWAYCAAWVVNAPVVYATVHTLPVVPERVLSALSYSLVINALIWGVYLGCAIRQHHLAAPTGKHGILFLQSLCLATWLAIGIGIALGQARHIPLLSTYAREWDVRHRHIISERERGQSLVVVEPLSTDLKRFMHEDADQIVCDIEYYLIEVEISDE